jgi:hypothetical protein
MMNQSRRKVLGILAGLSLFYPLTAFGKGKLFMKKETIVDVVVFNYINRPIFDVYLNERMVGGSASLSDSPYGQFSTVVGVPVPFGPQTLTWRDAGSGKNFSVKNPLSLTPEQIPPNSHSLAIHIYPDETAELIFSEDLVEQSPRGLSYAKEFQRHGK